jgi:hypothetical protein
VHSTTLEVLVVVQRTVSKTVDTMESIAPSKQAIRTMVVVGYNGEQSRLVSSTRMPQPASNRAERTNLLAEAVRGASVGGDGGTATVGALA